MRQWPISHRVANFSKLSRAKFKPEIRRVQPAIHAQHIADIQENKSGSHFAAREGRKSASSSACSYVDGDVRLEGNSISYPISQIRYAHKISEDILADAHSRQTRPPNIIIINAGRGNGISIGGGDVYIVNNGQATIHNQQAVWGIENDKFIYLAVNILFLLPESA